MTTLNFQPLQHMRDLQDCDCKHPKTCEKCRLKKPGVYIWGFLYNTKDGSTEKSCAEHKEKVVKWKIAEGDELTANKSSLNKKGGFYSDFIFIPYYVGMSEADVFGRLKDHKDFETGDSTKYVRLHEDYMLCYHKHILTLNSAGDSYPCLPLFPIKKASINNNFVWSLLANDGYVHYFNRHSSNYINKNNQNSIKVDFNHEKENDNYSIKDCDKDFNNDIKEKDPFKKRIEKCNNFWFTYCDLGDDLLIHYLNSKLNDLEKKRNAKNVIGKQPKRLIQEGNKLESVIKKVEELIQNLNNGNLDGKDRKNLFHQAEAATYFALRGITFSRTHTVEFPEGWKIQNNSGFNIFLDNAGNKKENNIRTCTPKDEFNWPGYW
jgi:hypothetical protein